MSRSDPHRNTKRVETDEHWCPDCDQPVILDDGCCGCGKVLDWDAFEAADKRLAELNADPDAALYAEADYRYETGRAF